MSLRNLSPERWEQLQRIFDEAVDLAAEKRVAFLDTACSGDAELRAQIEALAMAESLGLQPGDYGVVTLHRPSNVDQPAVLRTIVAALLEIAEQLPLVFPIHPRSKARLAEFGLLERLSAQPAVQLIEPQPYNAFMSLVVTARLIVTDSGGLQEETTYLGIPCLTLRENTERPITVSQGTNRLIKAAELAGQVKAILAGRGKSGRRPALWDGRTAERAAESLRRHGLPRLPKDHKAAS